MALPIIAMFMVALAPVQAGVPNQQPQLAVEKGSLDVVFGSGSTIWFERSRDGGKTFEQPVKVAEVPALMVRRHRGPRLTVAGRALVVTAVHGADGSSESGDLLAWRSLDGGAHWSTAVKVDDQPGAAREGLHAVAAGPGQELAAAWLDLRGKGTKLYGSVSHDGGATWSKNTLLFESAENTVCQCCHPSIVSTGPGQYAVMFRNVVGGSRDMYQLEWKVAGAPPKPVKVGTGTWTINACPMDGGGVAFDGRELVSAWRRDRTVYLAKGNAPEQPISEGKNVAIAHTAKGVFVAWTGVDGIQVQRPDLRAPMHLAAGGDFPVLAGMEDGRAAIAWEDAGTIKVQILP